MLQPHEERLISELEELKVRLEKLDAFLVGDIITTLPIEERVDLYQQSGAMHIYLDCLDRRISRITKEEDSGWMSQTKVDGIEGAGGK